MNKIVLALAFVGCCLAMPQQQSGAPKDNPFVKILNFESFQNGADFGHTLQQEDGTASGQKIGKDGLVYGFYSYIQDGGNPVKVYYRAGKGVGYEVLRVEGLDESTLGNLKPTISQAQPETPRRTQQVQQPRPFQNIPRQQSAPVFRQPAQPQPAAPVFRQPVQHRPAAPVFRQPVQPQPAAPVFRQPAPTPIRPQVNPLNPAEPTPAPHRFDYPANLNIQRTGTGFRSSFKAL